MTSKPSWKRDIIAFLVISVMCGSLVFNTVRISNHDVRIELMEEITRRTDDRWRGADQQKFEEELQKMNPGLILPKR